MIARRVGLSVPDYGVVTVTSPFADAAERSTEAERIRQNVGENFGCLLVSPALDLISGTADVWEPIITLDAICLNGDRKRENPNVVFDGDQVYLIDHGLAAPTWELRASGVSDDTLFGDLQILQHAGSEALQKKGKSYEALGLAWRTLVTAPFLAWAINQVPSSWLRGTAGSELRAFLDARGTISELQSAELREVLK